MRKFEFFLGERSKGATLELARKKRMDLLSPTAKNGMKLVDQTSPFSFKMDSPNRLQSPYPHQE
jgi:hypothetical protein